MKQLGSRNILLIRTALNTLGWVSHDDIVAYIEEELDIDEYDTITEFLDWLFDEIDGIDELSQDSHYEYQFKRFLNYKLETHELKRNQNQIKEIT